MKIAFVTDEGENVSAHFGRAAYYLVVDIEDGRETGRELREKMGHSHFHAEEHRHENHSTEAHGFDPQSQTRHVSMLEAIADCSVVVCGGMGQGAVHSIQSSGKDLRLTSEPSIDHALELFLAGNLPNQLELSH